MDRCRNVSMGFTGLLMFAICPIAAAAPTPTARSAPAHTEQTEPQGNRTTSPGDDQSAVNRSARTTPDQSKAVAAPSHTEQSATDQGRNATHAETTAPAQSKAVTAPEQTKRAASADRVTSQVLFERGRELFIAGNFADACPLFEESHRLSPGIGVLFHLGACLEKLGRLAAAWAAFEEAADRAKGERDSKREGVARSRAMALREKLAYMTLRVRDKNGTLLDAAAASSVALEILHNDVSVPNAAMGIEIPVTPGEQRVVVRAKGREAVEKRVTLGSTERGNVEVELGAVSEQVQQDGTRPTSSSSASASRIPSATSSSSASASRIPSATSSSSANASQLRSALSPKVTSGANPYALWSAIGVGSVGLITGGVAGLVAYTKMQEARALCEGHPKDDCPQSATTRQDEARFPARVSTIAVSVGAASLAVAGGYWLLSRRHQAVVAGSVQPGIALISVRSRW